MVHWPLQTTIERARKSFECPEYLISGREKIIVREFQRFAHHYLHSPPQMNEIVEWLALIQHHGGPTRLLDFTYSFYAAAFFAVEQSETDAAIWCVDGGRLDDLVTMRAPEETQNERRQRITDLANSILLRQTTEHRVLTVDPFRLNTRAALQQGCYLFPCDLATSFEENLYTGLGHEGKIFAERVTTKEALDMQYEDFAKYDVIKLELPHLFHIDTLRDLKRMNITGATLFPGLDGYARSLYHHMRAGEMLRNFMLENRIRNKPSSTMDKPSST